MPLASRGYNFALTESRGVRFLSPSATMPRGFSFCLESDLRPRSESDLQTVNKKLVKGAGLPVEIFPGCYSPRGKYNRSPLDISRSNQARHITHARPGSASPQRRAPAASQARAPREGRYSREILNPQKGLVERARSRNEPREVVKGNIVIPRKRYKVVHGQFSLAAFVTAILLYSRF